MDPGGRRLGRPTDLVPRSSSAPMFLAYKKKLVSSFTTFQEGEGLGQVDNDSENDSLYVAKT